MSKLIAPGVLFALVGAVFMAFASWLYWEDAAFAERALDAQGTVTENIRYYDDEGELLYRPVVTYSDEAGQSHTFSSSVSSSSPQFDIGETVDVLYDPAAPGDARVDAFMSRGIFPLAFGGLGLVAFLCGAGMVYAAVARKQAVAQLRASGVRIEAEIIGIREDESIEVNDEHPWRVTARGKHPRTGRMTTFKSDMLWSYPDGVEEGHLVPVLVAKNKPKRYLVDVARAVPARGPVTADEVSAPAQPAGFDRRAGGFGRRPQARA